LFEFLGLSEGLIRNENTHDQAVKELHTKATELTECVSACKFDPLSRGIGVQN